RIWFHCLVASSRGGETPIADIRRVLERLPTRLVEDFERKGVRYEMTFADGPVEASAERSRTLLNLGWPFYFGTKDRAEVEAKCARDRTEFEWLSGDGLRIWLTRPAIHEHPLTRERIFFNHVNVYASSAVKPHDARGAHDGRGIFFGDGS